jgi:putative hydrolase of the HAD superfamily
MRCLVWDFDNTLAYRPGMWSQCLAELANEVLPGAGFTREQFVPHLASGFPWHTPEVGHPELSSSDAWWLGLHPLFARALEAGAGIDPQQAAVAAHQVRSKYLVPEAWRVYPDVEPAIAALSAAGWSHIILSNHVPELPQLVSQLGLAVHFFQVLTSAALGYEKPHPAAFAAAVSAVPVGTRLVMVGDSFAADYKGAIAAGLKAVLVRGSHPDCEVSLPDLHALVVHLHDA